MRLKGVFRGFLLKRLAPSVVASSSAGEVGRGCFKVEGAALSEEDGVMTAVFAEAFVGEEWPRVTLESVDVFTVGSASSEDFLFLLGFVFEGRASSLPLECEDDDGSAGGTSFVVD